MARFLILFGLVFSMALGACNAPNPEASAVDKAQIVSDITHMLSVQDKAWNAGNIDGFMEYYWKNSDLRFASAGNVNRGWQATLDGYKKRYPDADAMGTLSFKNLEIKVLSHEYAQVFGRWELERANDNPGGLFTLLLQKQNDNWVIVSDHTSSDEN